MNCGLVIINQTIAISNNRERTTKKRQTNNVQKQRTKKQKLLNLIYLILYYTIKYIKLKYIIIIFVSNMLEDALLAYLKAYRLSSDKETLFRALRERFDDCSFKTSKTALWAEVGKALS